MTSWMTEKPISRDGAKKSRKITRCSLKQSRMQKRSQTTSRRREAMNVLWRLRSDFRRLKQDLSLFSQDEEEEDSLILPSMVHMEMNED